MNKEETCSVCKKKISEKQLDEMFDDLCYKCWLFLEKETYPNLKIK